MLHENLDEILRLEIRVAELDAELATAYSEVGALDNTSNRLEMLERVVLATQKARVAQTEEEWNQANFDLDNALKEAGLYHLTTDQETSVETWRNVFGEQRKQIADLESKVSFWADRFRALGSVLSKIARDHNGGYALTGEAAYLYKEWASEALKTYANGLVTD